MEHRLKKQLSENSLNFKKALDRIIEKYTNLGDGGIEVDIKNINLGTLERYMRMSRNKLEPELDSICEDDAVDETSGSTSLLDADERDETESSVEVGGSRLFEFQPEDQDEVLQMSLSSHGSSLGELYPDMIRRMERAWNLQHASVAASSVLRKYRRWRRQSKRNSLNSTFDVTLRHTSGGPKKMASKAPLKESYNSPGKKQLLRGETAPWSALQTITSVYDGQTQQQSPGKERGLQERGQPHVRVMDFSESFTPKKLSLNETFTVSTLSPPKAAYLGEQVPVFTGSPSRPCYAAAKASTDSFFKIRGVSLPSHSAQTTMCSTYPPEIPAVEERPDIYSSPVRRSPFKPRMMTSLSRSPHACSRSRKEDYVTRYSRESVKPRSLSTSLSSSPERPVVQLRRLHPQDSHPSPQPQLCSPYSAEAVGAHHKLRRHLSFDSVQPLKPNSYSPKKIDEDFMKLYHKFMCQNKSNYFNGPPCRLCARSSEASRGHSSSALAALALSPHRSVLRKRHRELGWEAHPNSKRFKEEHCTHSPGSSRYTKQMLRQCLSASPCEPLNGGISCSPSKYRRQQPTMHQEAWMSRHQPAPDHFGLGVPHEREMANSYSPSWLR